MIAEPFIRRPLVACVLSAFIVIVGLISLRALSVSLYPDVLPPTIQITTSYPGATSAVISETVASPLEQQVNGAEGMIYIHSGASPSGQVNVDVTFAVGTDPNEAMIDVQNRVQAALPLLPEEVRRQGVVVRKLNVTAVAYLSVNAPDGRYDDSFVANYTLVNVVNELRRVPGVAAVDAYGAREHAMRIWLQPDKLAQVGLTPMDVAAAVREQNSQFATGRVGDEPLGEPTDLVMSITTKGRLTTPAEFERIILKAGDDGAIVRLADVARVELGARDYALTTFRKGKPAVVVGVFPQPGANVIEISDAVRATMKRLEKDFPAGLEWQVPFDTTDFVRVAIKEVLKTLAEAVALVFLVTFIFLPSWRATLIPCLAVPVSLIGALAGMLALGASINLATLFAMVLAIGIVVDDAIVVVENVERHMVEGGMGAVDATRKAMAEVTGPLIAIVLVLTAVFLPVAFLGGLVGEVYRQFAITISTAVLISGVVALTLTPALCVLLLKPAHNSPTGVLARFRAWFERVSQRYAGAVGFLLRHGRVSAVLMLLMLAATVGLSRTVPTSLVPEEDQGYVMAFPFLQPAASLKRTNEVMRKLETELAGHGAMFETLSFSGFDPYNFFARPGAGLSFFTFKPWDERKAKALQAPAVLNEINALGATINDAVVVAAPPPPIEGLSATGGFEGWVQARGGQDYKALEAATNKLIAAAAQRPELAGVFTPFTAQVPQVEITVDREQAKLLGVSVQDVFATLQSTFGSYYVNDFSHEGRVYRVQMQADAPYRTRIDDLRHVYVRSRQGEPIPVTALGEVRLVTGPELVERFNAYAAARVLGGPAPGYSSGQALAAMEALAAEHLPDGFSLAWSSQAFLEKQTQTSTAGLYVLAALVVFLILAVQYGSLSLPFAAILSVPFAIFGALAAIWGRGLYNDLYFQIGLVTLVGLSAKNAILVVSFAAARMREGTDGYAAAVEAARVRFRPILMTSLAFILGVLPLALSTGAGANARHSIGTGVVGGMLAATFIAPLFTPVLFVWCGKAGELLRSRLAATRAR